MKRRARGGTHATWKRQRQPRVRYPPNDTYMRAYEEAVILADIARHPGEWIGCRELRQQTPMRYSVKLKSVLERMARNGGRLEMKGGRSFGRIAPVFRIRTNTMRKAA